jgi:hypothetical protein
MFIFLLSKKPDEGFQSLRKAPCGVPAMIDGHFATDNANAPKSFIPAKGDPMVRQIQIEEAEKNFNDIISKSRRGMKSSSWRATIQWPKVRL